MHIEAFDCHLAMAAGLWVLGEAGGGEGKVGEDGDSKLHTYLHAVKINNSPNLLLACHRRSIWLSFHCVIFGTYCC